MKFVRYSSLIFFFQSLGLVIGNKDVNKNHSSDKSNAATLAAVARQMSTYLAQQHQEEEEEEEGKTADMDDDEEIVEDDDEEEEVVDDEDENHSLIIVDENQPDDELDDKQKSISNQTRSNNNLRCRQCDYEAKDLSDLLLHRKAHALMKDKHLANHSDIENDDEGKNRQITFDEQMFDYGK